MKDCLTQMKLDMYFNNYVHNKICNALSSREKASRNRLVEFIGY